ncbi:hypothetical protein GCM10009797_03310 [Nocardioides hwasunensis]
MVMGAIVLVVAPATALPASAEQAGAVPPHPASPLAGLPRDVAHGQVVRLVDGDRYEVTRSAGGKEIQGRRRDAATGEWSGYTTVFRQSGLRCWNVQARGAGTGVAVTFECGLALVEPDEGKPYAAASADTTHWQSRRLPGYLWGAPAISPAGTWAAWLRGRDYMTWSLDSGFAQHRTTRSTGRFEGAQAPLVADDGSVTVAWASSARCTTTFDTYLAAGEPTREVVTDPRACDDFVTSLDARTVLLGDTGDRWAVTRLTRADETSPWAVTAVAPLLAPGLVTDTFEPDFAPHLLDAPELPLAVVANSGDDLGVQLYDPVAQAWQAPLPLLSRPGGSRCSFEDDATSRIGFYALTLRCRGGERRVVTSTDGATWQALAMRSRIVGRNDRAGLLAVPVRTRTVVLSRGADPLDLPVTVDRRCDVVHPVARDRVLRVTATATSAGWPALLQRSTDQGWRTVRRLDLPHVGTCRRVSPGGVGGADFQLGSRRGTLDLRFVHRGGRWDVRRMR